ncbi:Na+/glutamate symporter-like protein [Spirochaeta thermophila DSM 6578]|uniref:Na+/glutamate symporter-like protein n=1 Tax=Winmispira thermophila (strain ATCC 700085 / DSM 6578 / Z-1203) TaxID=869211 RepID=G0GBF9_WINT7|nr:sodium:glutamate symporter [Spirochaeta thermophila]AEJ60318.1 Na+/glutamate symporter-like protein [Spirochaeta thermophila DSM 6578]
MNMDWTLPMDFAVLSLLLLTATLLKRKVPLLRKLLFPNALIAGFIGLLLGRDLLALIEIPEARLGTYVYHLMAIGFIALALKERTQRDMPTIVRTGAFIVSGYLLQGIIGLGLTLLLLPFIPHLFPAFGLLLPLGFGQGPGQAYSIGSRWEALGFPHGGNIGLSVATIGFLWACLGGIVVLNILFGKKARKAAPDDEESPHLPGEVVEYDAPGDIPLTESIDRLSIQGALIGFVYLATYLTLKGVELLLEGTGTFGQTFSQLLWGFHFIVGSLYAIGLRLLFNLFKRKGLMHRTYPNTYLLSRISAGAFDYMITASIVAISLDVFTANLLPILLITTTGGLATVLFSLFVGRRIYHHHWKENATAVYGNITGTISTGLALIREVDPLFSSHAAENLVFGSGVGLVMGLPLLLVLNLPVYGYLTGTPSLYWITMAILVLYFAGLLAFTFRNAARTRRTP